MRSRDTVARKETVNIAGFEDQGRGPEAKEYGQSLETGKDKKTDSRLELSERNS